MHQDDGRKQRLSLLCKKLRGDESVRSFTKKRAKELGGINFSTWSAWERGQADLSKDSLDKLVKFIGCSHEALGGYLNNFIGLEELFQPSSNNFKPNEESDFSPEVTTAWVKSLATQDKLFVATQGLQAFQEEFDKFVEARAKEKIELLLNLLSGSTYPENSKIEETATRLDLSVEDLRKLCDRLFKSK